MSESEIIECTYGHHMTARSNFTPSGLNIKYYTICRSCKTNQMRAYRQKYREKYNAKQSHYMLKWRQEKKNEVQEID